MQAEAFDLCLKCDENRIFTLKSGILCCTKCGAAFGRETTNCQPHMVVASNAEGAD